PHVARMRSRGGKWIACSRGRLGSEPGHIGMAVPQVVRQTPRQTGGPMALQLAAEGRSKRTKHPEALPDPPHHAAGVAQWARQAPRSGRTDLGDLGQQLLADPGEQLELLLLQPELVLPQPQLFLMRLFLPDQLALLLRGQAPRPAAATPPATL